MELAPEQQSEITEVLARHPIGIKYKTLWDKCKTFDSELELSQVMHRMIQLGLVFKKFDLYFKEGQTPPEQAPKPEPVRRTSKMKPASVQYNEDTDIPSDDGDADDEDADSDEDLEVAAHEKIDKAEKRVIVRPVGLTPVAEVNAQAEQQKKNGNTQRTRSAGAALLAIYKLRDCRPLTLDDLVFFTGSSKTTLYAAMQRAISAGYVLQDRSGRHPLFKWSDKFKYPFDKWKATDDRLMANTINDWKAKEGLLVKAGTPVDEAEEGVEVETSTSQSEQERLTLAQFGVLVPKEPVHRASATLAHIDSQIQIHEAQLATLRSIREFMLASEPA